MNPTNHPPGPGGAHDALFDATLLDQMEQELVWLTTAPITSQVIAVPPSASQNGPITHTRTPEDPWIPHPAPAPTSPRPG